MTNDIMITADGLVKRYGTTTALDGVSFSVARGQVLGLLGPNGAGKTTAVRVLTTLAIPDGGSGRVAGWDVVTTARKVRQHIGVAAQDATLDGLLSGKQNLVLIGTLCGMGKNEAHLRADELLHAFELEDAANRVMKGYSGGMRRRLDLAASLMTRPPVLFLDEPTTGLDPTSRQRVWDAIRTLVATGVTVLLTTQYLEEADMLADNIVVVDHGKVIASGAPQELKESSKGARVEITLAAPSEGAVAVMRPFFGGTVSVSDDGKRLEGGVDNAPGLATALVRALDDQGIQVDRIEVRQPSLDDVFFALTGTHVVDEDQSTVSERGGIPS